MPSLLAFNKISINAVVIDTSDFVNGSGSLKLAGNDSAVTTADGRIHNLRKTLTPTCDLEVYGDHTSKNTPAGLAVEIIVSRDATALKTFNGIVTATYNENNNTTNISVSGDPE